MAGNFWFLEQQVGFALFSALALTARCAFVLQNRAQGTVSTNAYLGKGNPLRVPRCIPSGCPVPFMTHSANPRGITVVFGSWLSASGRFRHRRQRVAVASPARRASVLPQAPPRPNGRIRRPSGHPRPTVRRLDAATFSRVDTTKGA